MTQPGEPRRGVGSITRVMKEGFLREATLDNSIKGALVGVGVIQAEQERGLSERDRHMQRLRAVHHERETLLGE